MERARASSFKSTKAVAPECKQMSFLDSLVQCQMWSTYVHSRVPVNKGGKRLAYPQQLRDTPSPFRSGFLYVFHVRFKHASVILHRRDNPYKWPKPPPAPIRTTQSPFSQYLSSFFKAPYIVTPAVLSPVRTDSTLDRKNSHTAEKRSDSLWFETFWNDSHEFCRGNHVFCAWLDESPRWKRRVLHIWPYLEKSPGHSIHVRIRGDTHIFLLFPTHPSAIILIRTICIPDFAGGTLFTCTIQPSLTGQ